MLTLSLMNHTFEVPCEPEDREMLIEAATLLEDKLEQAPNLKGESKVLMVALNLCYDYLQLKQDTSQYCLRLDQQLETLQKLQTDTHS
ncbi:MAG: cell division protein ZapA [Piscirickettsiaceae bacterium CG_4_10_14_3_um_filter_44_349]|nr:cell division protein ZapA [Thiomicrospira sp.]OIP93575.1 MAG: cell division protein ZapA [Thiomicrospira sp. CG2_30_44_34]PIQ06181.1 MAG: cell division protein ZapA [Piscirickettsiaceae bacterium CG18_big_fil_WC_8_21_14_2_50_44_103]PIU39186.1 MAG: cell division protein ZapA [Piscirickettsiaceae bacterium CG07_land_8_20_14_0_80_44_28]PIW78629.1 MAG: cell division protein ZapA [Piscirickettsiaceae bacterium CG_4_8_14_3_um_filter_44_38]PIX80039.1 MAG: cell division protein ZapA [Pisciricketts